MAEEGIDITAASPKILTPDLEALPTGHALVDEYLAPLLS